MMLGDIVEALKTACIPVNEKATPQPTECFPQAFVEFWDFYKIGGRWIARYAVNTWCESHDADQFAVQSRQVLQAIEGAAIVVDRARRLPVEDMLRKSQRLGMIQFIVKARG